MHFTAAMPLLAMSTWTEGKGRGPVLEATCYPSVHLTSESLQGYLLLLQVFTNRWAFLCSLSQVGLLHPALSAGTPPVPSR